MNCTGNKQSLHMMRIVHWSEFALVCLILVVHPVIHAKDSGDSNQQKKIRHPSENIEFVWDTKSPSPDDMCYFRPDTQPRDDYPTVLVVNISAYVLRKFRRNYDIFNSIENFKDLQGNRICNYVLRIGKSRKVPMFAESQWCRDSILFTEATTELSDMLVYIPVKSASGVILAHCRERWEKFLQNKLESDVARICNPTANPVTVTVDHKFHSVHVETLTFHLLKNNDTVMANPWPEEWNDLTRKLIYEWLKANNYFGSLVSIKLLHQQSTSSGYYDLELVWDVSDPQVKAITEFANLKESIDEYFQDTSLNIRLGNMRLKNDPQNNDGNLLGQLINISTGMQRFEPPRAFIKNNCYCSQVELTKTLLVAVSTSENISLEANGLQIFGAENPIEKQIRKDLEALDGNGLPIKKVDATGVYTMENQKGRSVLTLFFDQLDEEPSSERVKYTLNSLKTNIDLTKYGIEIRRPDQLRWKAVLTTCRYSNMSQIYIDFRMNVIITATDELLRSFVDQITSMLSEVVVEVALKQSSLFNGITHFRRIGEKTQMTFSFIIDMQSMISEQPQMADFLLRGEKDWAPIMQHVLSAMYPDIRITMDMNWFARDVVCSKKHIDLEDALRR